MVDRARLNKYASDYFSGVTEEQLEKIADFGDMVLSANEHINLTAIIGEPEFTDKHLLDSLRCAALRELSGVLLDLGSGAGFPGAVTAAARGDLQVVLMDSTRKKLDFAENACASAGIPVSILHMRAEEAARKSEYREHFDCLVARAVANLASLCELALPLVRVGGHFIAMKGPSYEEELAAARDSIKKLGGEYIRSECYELPEGDRRALVIIKKASSTPEKYPRSLKSIHR